MQPLLEKVRVKGQIALKTKSFWRFSIFRSNPLRKSGCQKLRVFLQFWCTRICSKICSNNLFCTYGFFKKPKISANRQKKPKIRFFCDFFMLEATLCSNPGFECQKLDVFGHFCMTESVQTTCFAA